MLTWYDVTEPNPPLATRVLVMTVEGRWLPGKLTLYGWLDDNSLPIRNVVKWSYVQ